MIQLHSFGTNFGVMDPSPFVVKVDLFLRVAKLPYEVITGSVDSLKISPKNKLPFIEDKGVQVGDSTFILDYLTKTYQIEIDNFLTKEQQANAHLMGKSLDESLYWCLVYSRWLKEDTWPLLREAFFGNMPALLKLFVPNVIRKSVKKNLYGQGLGRHSESEIQAIAKQSFLSLSVLLGEKIYFFGEQISSFDVTVYAHLSEFITVDFSNEFNELARSYPNLIEFCRRIEKQYY